MPKKKTTRQKYKEVTLDIGTKPDGSRDRLHFYGYTPEEAKAKRTQWVADHPTQASIDSRDMTYAQWASVWQKSCLSGLEYNTIQMYRNNVQVLSALPVIDAVTLGDLKMTDIKSIHVNAAFGALDGKSRSQIKQCRSTHGQIVQAAVDNGIIKQVPTGKLRTPKGTYEGHRVLTDAEKAAVDACWPLWRTGLWFMVLLYTGLRRGELAALTWEQGIDLDKGIISVTDAVYFEKSQHPKSKETKSAAGVRTVPIVAPLRAALGSVPIEQRKGWLCKSAGGERMTLTTYTQGLKTFSLICERYMNGIKPYERVNGWRRDKLSDTHVAVDFTAHDFRYTYASMLYDAGVDVKTAQYLMGHSDVMTTMKIYTKLSEGKKTVSVDKLTEYFAAGQVPV